MRGGWVYIMTNRPNGTLYTGVTANIARRAYEHREGLCKGFTKRYALKRLAWFEFHDDITAAIQRDVPRMIALFRAGRLPVDQLLTHRLNLEEINEGSTGCARESGFGRSSCSNRGSLARSVPFSSRT
jgi:predicted GIY-YIG superfamily endonuclease